jgi:peptidoglycan/LPS O-acetylase OafA/YrhL
VGVVAIFGDHAWLASVPGATTGQGVSLVVALEAAGAALLYLTNWCDIFHLFTGYVPLEHLWSLAVEEQLYLVWAPLLALVLARARRWAFALALALAVGSFLDVLVLHHTPTTSTWVYRGTDTRMGTFLVGGALAIAWAGPLARSKTWARSTRVIPGAALGALVWSAWVIDHPSSADVAAIAWVAASVAGPLLVVAMLDRHRDGGRSVFARALPGYLGRRSYALYLWHYVWLTWLSSLGLAGVVGALAATLCSAELSWRLVEARALAFRRHFGGAHSPQTVRPVQPVRTHPRPGSLPTDTAGTESAGPGAGWSPRSAADQRPPRRVRPATVGVLVHRGEQAPAPAEP